MEQNNPFQVNAPILYSLKTLKNQRFSGAFSGYKMENLVRNRLKKSSKIAQEQKTLTSALFLIFERYYNSFVSGRTLASIKGSILNNFESLIAQL